ncbi:MAG: hypothetical protein JSW27_01730 [Phycisphaerales bacterium]|nr:MAG: hypothetical protein JSW27_01730 [Phycisphaerales bacterium]
MKNPIMKLALSAAFIGGVSLFIVLTVKTSAPAYALEQTVAANNQLRSLHMKSFAAAHGEPKEFWLQCDESGHIQDARWYMPAWDAPEDGAKAIVWKGGRLQIWFKGRLGRPPCLVTYTRQQPPFWLLDFARMSDPKIRIARLKEAQAKDEVELEIQEPADQAQPIVVTATYLRQSPSPGRRTVLRVDQMTKLVTSVEVFVLEDGQYALQYRQEFSEYNVPIDAAMFDLNLLVPADVRRIDGDARENSGLPQGALSDNEIAVKVVRQFFEALIARDYETAGQLYCGTPAEELKQGFFGKTRIIRIVEIGEPTPHPIPEIEGLRVPCKVEIEKEGVKSEWEPYGPFVRTIHRRSDHPRWEIHGGL